MNLEEQIQKRIDELIASPDPDLADLRGVAQLLKALPISAGYNGWLALRPDGSLVYLDDTEQITEEKGAEIKFYSLLLGSEKYPELRVLLPARPENANDCKDCKGTGKSIIEGIQAFCGKCSGLGWII
jgi:hypothetical protein